jgi:putative transposase
MSTWTERATLVAALKAAIEYRKPPAGCVHHSDRGSQLTFKRSSQHLNQRDCDGHSKATITPVWTRAVAIAGATAGSGTN